MPFINSRSIFTYSTSDYAAHLREIRNHWSRLQVKRKAEVKARQAEYKVPTKDYSTTINKKNTLVLTIRNRKPPYLYASEWRDLESTYPDRREELQKIIARRKITIKKDPA